MGLKTPNALDVLVFFDVIGMPLCSE